MKQKVKSTAPSQTPTFNTNQELVEYQFFKDVLQVPQVKLKNQVMANFAPTPAKEFKGSRADHDEMFVDMFIDRVFNLFGEKITKMRNKPVKEIIAHLVLKRAKNIQYNNKVWKA